MSLEMAHKVIFPPQKNYIPQFLKQRDINSYSAPFPSTLQCDSDRKRAGMKQISEVEEKPFTSSLNICPEARDGIFKSFRSPEIDSEESIPPANVST
jgi:hypothetical protein